MKSLVSFSKIFPILAISKVLVQIATFTETSIVFGNINLKNHAD